MRLLICNELIAFGGIGTYTLSLARAFKQRGWSVGFITTHAPDEYFDEIKVLTNPCSDISAMPLGWKKIMHLLAFTKDYSPDVLFLNHCSLAHYILPFLPMNIRPVAVLHNDVQHYYRTAALFKSRIFRWIAPSQKLNDAFRKYLPSSQHEWVRTIQHGVDETRFVYHKRSTPTRGIVFIGNIGENKGADYLPSIFARVHARFPHVQLRIVGTGSLKTELEQKFSESNIPVSFMGGVLHDKIPAILADADILLLPSRVEGFGLVIAEAMMCGAVPIVTSIEGITDGIVDDGISGYLVETGDIAGFVQCLTKLVEESEMFLKMSQAAANRALERFTLSRMVEEYEMLFAEEDRRTSKPVSGNLAWGLETIFEMLKKGPDGSIPMFSRIGNLLNNFCKVVK
jgi:glycosyltransferase involved in cell wall biosynthesis